MTQFTFTDFSDALESVQEEGITFEDKQLTWDKAEDVKDVVTALETNKIVHYMKLEGNTLGVDAARAISEALKKHPEFRKAFWRNLFTRRTKEEIPKALKHLSDALMFSKAQLTVLDLSDNALGPNGMVGLEKLLQSSVCFTLQELRLNNCGLGQFGGRMLSKAIIACYDNSIAAGTPLKLKTFITGRNRLENEGAKAIANIFLKLKTLEEIGMPENSIYHEGIGALSKAFKQNPNLRILNLNDNTVTHKGAAHLAEIFSFTPHLREINFGDCLLKTNGAYLFANALESNHTELEVIDLSFNEIDADSGLTLIGALKNKPNIKRVNLDGNQFGREGCSAMRVAMASTANPDALESLDEDQSENEDDDEGGDDDEDDDDVDDEDDFVDDEEDDIEDDDDEDYEDERHNDTTEEADEYEEDESAYTTSKEFTFKSPFNITGATTPTVTPQKNVTFATNLTTITPTVTPQKNVTFATNLTTTTPPTVTPQKNVTFATSITTTNDKLNAEKFVLNRKPCTLEIFEGLEEENKFEAFNCIINQFKDDNQLLLLIFTTLKCAHLAQSSPAALDLSIQFYNELFNYAIRTKQERRIVNYMLIQLGLLRTEEKFTPIYNLNSCRFALQKTLEADQINNDYIKNIFDAFLKNNS